MTPNSATSTARHVCSAPTATTMTSRRAWTPAAAGMRQTTRSSQPASAPSQVRAQLSSDVRFGTTVCLQLQMTRVYLHSHVHCTCSYMHACALALAISNDVKLEQHDLEVHHAMQMTRLQPLLCTVTNRTARSGRVCLKPRPSASNRTAAGRP